MVWDFVQWYDEKEEENVTTITYWMLKRRTKRLIGEAQVLYFVGISNDINACYEVVLYV
ncbi:hypothetical protein SAMN06265218_10392 [Fodinibius sediminis]|uniref:Uncharacterized protein n=1 Tax=Fodinibius sediminis TaxID=1214077 RepID=A0A521BGK6_9BACT|nr:hypothetical protein SAMN06265218_10392 [Fodinibius sediminis]